MQRISIVSGTSALLLASAASAAWDAASAFSVEYGNPNGAWSYGWMPIDFSTFTLFENYGYPNGNPQWWGWGGDNTPGIWRNEQGAISYGVPPEWLSVHPGNGTEPCVLRWTAPADVGGSVSVVGQFLAGDIGIMQVAVHHNGKSVWSAVDAGSFDLDFDVQPGDTIDFAAYGAYFYGNTALTVVIDDGVAPCIADLDHDGVVNAADLAVLLGAWGERRSSANLDGAGTVGASDLAILLGAWGPC